MLTYNATDGKRIRETPIADLAKRESVLASLLAWNGPVFAGNAGGDDKNVKGSSMRSTRQASASPGNNTW